MQSFSARRELTMLDNTCDSMVKFAIRIYHGGAYLILPIWLRNDGEYVSVNGIAQDILASRWQRARLFATARDTDWLRRRRRAISRSDAL